MIVARRIATAATLGCLLLGCGSPSEPAPNVVLVVIDTLRADRVACYGYPRPTTPRLDALAARGVRFEDVSSTSSWTLPAHASIFTGLFPIEHGATQEHTELDTRADTLAEILAAHGYATLGVSGNGVVNRGSGLARGFETFVETWRRHSGVHPSPDQHPNLLAVREFLAGLGPDEPFFAFVNYVEVHGPYQPPEPYRSRFLDASRPPGLVASALERRTAEYYLDPSSISAQEFAVLNDLYDGEVAYADALVGALVDELEKSGRLADTLLIVTSDHGENIGDHGHFRHVFSLYNSTVKVPLIAVLPGGKGAGETREAPASLVDLFPTILRQAGIEPRDDRGRDLLADFAGEQTPLYAEYYFPLQALGLFGPSGEPRALAPYLRRLRSVEANGWRLIWSSDGRRELYDLKRDPGELRNLAGDSAAAAPLRQLDGLLDAYVARRGGGPPLPQAEDIGLDPIGAFGQPDEETARHLRELGYLGEAAADRD